MTYDPYTGNFGDDVFGGEPLFAVDVEDDILITTDDVEDDGGSERTPFSIPSGDIPSGTIGVISYDRGDNEIIGRPTQVGGDDVVGPGRGPTKSERDSAQRVRERQAANTGNRNIRRVATDHPRGDTEAAAGGQRGVESSISDAQDRLIRTIRSDGGSDRVTGDVGRITGGVEPLPVDRDKKDKLDEYLRIVAAGKVPQVTHSLVRNGAGPKVRVETIDTQVIEFDSEIYGVKMNAAGDWLVTLKVPFTYRDAVTDLSGVTGLNMRTRMEANGLAN